MPRYIIERQYLLPVYQHLAVEAPDLGSACRDALDDGEHDWKDAQEDYESTRPTTIVSAVEIASEEEWREFTERNRLAELAEILERNDCGKARVLIDGDDLKRLKSIAEMGVDR